MASTKHEDDRSRRRDQIDDMIRKGSSNSEISVTMACSESFVTRRRLVVASASATSGDVLADSILAFLKKAKKTTWSIDELADRLDVGPSKVRGAVAKLQASGRNISLTKGVELMTEVPTALTSRIDVSKFKGERIAFGLTADNHLGSKYSRLDVLNALFDIWQDQGITTVYQCGNMIDGDARFNKFDLLVHGMNDQVNYFVEHWPQRKGMKTYFITGDDHEGWYIQREGVEIGRMIESYARDAGRSDLTYLGHVEHDIVYQAKHGEAVMRIIHAGGGSAYATSYTAQKIVECVPLSSEILTTDGWKTHDQLSVGDVVMGYNQETKKCEWTILDAINAGVGEINTYENDQFKVECTPNHKWIMDVESRAGANKNSRTPVKYRKEDQRLATIDEFVSDWRRARIVQAAEGPEGPGAVIDAHVEWMDRAGAVRRVLSMTKEERRGFIYGMLVGEGTLTDSGSVIFSQRPGAVQDAFVLACFLEGIACGSTQLTTKKLNGDDKICGRTTVLRKNRRMVNSMSLVKTEMTNVWCPTTRLGTWVMRQGDVVTITGNSYQGGEKPQILLIGHYHKAEYGYPREVHVVQAGCTEDQTIFMRKQKIQAHVGGWTIGFDLSEDGLVHAFTPQFHPFYDRGFYDKDGKGQWSAKWKDGNHAKPSRVAPLMHRHKGKEEPWPESRGGNGGK